MVQEITRNTESAKTITFWILALLVAATIGALAARPADAATFSVNRTGDAPDANINNAACDTSAAQAGNQCTLRAAIQEANDTAAPDTINFNIVSNPSVKTISPGSPLPTISETATINGYSQQGAGPNTPAPGNDAVLKVQLNGSGAGTDANGLRINASDSTIRGLVVNRFDGSGILITTASATGNEVLGNFIGTNAAGTTPLGNDGDGVEIDDAPDNLVGGTTSAARNVISGNGSGGVEIDGQAVGSTATGNRVQGNLIGTGADGTGDLGNGGNGVEIFFAPNNTVGGTVGGAGNVLSGNGLRGVEIFGSSSTDNDVKGNVMRSNTFSGVLVFFGSNNTIGGGNLIFSNGSDGVTVNSSTGNSVLSNQIFGNAGLGIDLNPDGVTTNDTDDPDTGANNLQNFPVITLARRSGTLTTITGTLNSNPDQEFTIQCFLAADGDASNHGEGQIFLAQDTTVSTNASGDGNFTCTTQGVPTGQEVSATATNEASGDTCEFSLNRTVIPSP